MSDQLAERPPVDPQDPQTYDDDLRTAFLRGVEYGKSVAALAPPVDEPCCSQENPHHAIPTITDRPRIARHWFDETETFGPAAGAEAADPVLRQGRLLHAVGDHRSGLTERPPVDPLREPWDAQVVALVDACTARGIFSPVDLEAAFASPAPQGLDEVQASLPEGWSLMVGYTTECPFCLGWWATASKRPESPADYSKIVTSESDRPRGAHHDATSAEAIRALLRRLSDTGERPYIAPPMQDWDKP